MAGNAFTVASSGIVDGSTTGYALTPQVTILNPSKGKVVSGSFKLQVHVWSPTTNGITDVLSYAYTTNGSAPDCSGTAKTLTQNGNYASGSRSGVFEATLAPGEGTYTLRACARTSAGVVQASPVTVVVRTAGTGDGNLLVRDNSEQLCTDCHNLRTHASQSTSLKYGSWSTSCRDCHTPHGSKNTYLLKSTITPPPVNGAEAPQSVNFRITTGDSGVAGATNPSRASFVNSDGTGPCQVCHTRTANPWDTSKRRYQVGGNDDKHWTQDAGTQNCVSCHKHKNGFGPESRGGDTCDQCHTKIWQRMNGTVAVGSRHPIGTDPTVNTAATDSGITWGNPLSTNAAASRSCMNMCHPDKQHNQPGGWSHAYGVYGDATSAATRAITRGNDGEITGPANVVCDTDFDASNAACNLCVSCHQNPLTGSADRLTISRSTYANTAHDFDTEPNWGTTWAYQLRDGTSYRRNCTKCHSDRADKQPTDDTYPFGAVHYSQYPKLLAGSLKPGQDGTGVFLCYNCHGNGTDGKNRSNDLATPMGEFYAHPVDQDQAHLFGDAEYNAAAYGNQLGNAGNRHANCLDCHNVHQTKRGGHTYLTGTVSTSGTTVTGTGTRWSSFYVGARIRLGSKGSPEPGGGTWYTTTAVNGPTQLTLSSAPTAQPAGTYYRIERQTNLAGPTLDGAWGIAPTYDTTTGNANTIGPGEKITADAQVTKKKLVMNSDKEGYLCFKCHSSFWWGSATPPPSASGFSYSIGTATFTKGSTTVTGSGTSWWDANWTSTTKNKYVGAVIQNTADGTWYTIASVASSGTSITLASAYTGNTATNVPYAIQMAHTDQVQEFNPNSAGFHPVMGGYSGRSNGGTSNIVTPWTISSTMACSDCHEADAPNDPGGPHGSAYKFMLRGPNRLWDESLSITTGAMPSGVFCMNCHNSSFSNSRFPDHTNSNHTGIPCFNCHIAIPHGSSTAGLLNNGNTSATGFSVGPYDQSTSSTRYNRGSYTSRLWVLGTPTGTNAWAKSDCGCGGTGHH